MLDFGLPCKDGFEILAELAETSPIIRAVPIVILTGHADFEYVRNNFSLWIPAYINKPLLCRKDPGSIIEYSAHSKYYSVNAIYQLLLTCKAHGELFLNQELSATL